jgi:hypothetical protein
MIWSCSRQAAEKRLRGPGFRVPGLGVNPKLETRDAGNHRRLPLHCRVFKAPAGFGVAPVPTRLRTIDSEASPPIISEKAGEQSFSTSRKE